MKPVNREQIEAGKPKHVHAFVVPGMPVAKGRPRFSSVGGKLRTFTPAKTRHYEDLVKLCAKRANVPLLEGPVGLKIGIRFPCLGPPRKKVPRPECWKATSPDMSNILKAIEDALNGIAYVDDGQVCWVQVSKWHGAQSQEPCVIVRVWSLLVEHPTGAFF